MEISYKTHLSPQDSAKIIIDKILISRGLTTAAKRREFLNPPPPTLALLVEKLGLSIKNLDKSAKIITNAIKSGHNICIYGDYDADGITATAILYNALQSLGARVLPFIPHRTKHGYGLSMIALKEILSGEAFADTSFSPFIPELLITVDNGIVASKEIQFLKSKNVQVILTDHHQLTNLTPPADVIIHSTKTSGAGIAWILALHLCRENQFSRDQIDLATIGIVADQMLLTGINRIIVAKGLEKLSVTSNIGLLQLYESANITNKAISTYDINFAIAPRINAIGRLEHAIIALRLLCTNNMNKAKEIANVLNQKNKLRQDMTDQAILHAKHHTSGEKLVITASDAYHEGIIGLVAGKLAEETGKPSLAISLGKKIAKGSARSIPGLDITKLLKKKGNLLTSIGGHKMAAGFSLPLNLIDQFIKEITAIANDEITNEMLTRSLSVDAELSLDHATKELHDKILQMKPFGMGNPKPKFLSSGVVTLDDRFVGSNNQHKKLTIRQKSASKNAIWFRSNNDLDLGLPRNYVYSIDINTWKNREYLQLMIRHVF